MPPFVSQNLTLLGLEDTLCTLLETKTTRQFAQVNFFVKAIFAYLGVIRSEFS